MKNTKKLVAIIMCTVISLGAPQTVKAAEIDNSTQNSIIELEERYGLSEEEIINLDENIDDAFEELRVESGKRMKDGTIVKNVKVSENLILEVTTTDTIEQSVHSNILQAKAAKSYDRSISSKLSLKNVIGVEIVSLTATGKFRTNGSTSTPIDAYGTYNATVWNITSVDTAKGSAAYNSWARVSFSSQFNVGIDPVSMTIQSRADSCTIYCNAKGSYSSSWQ